MADADFLVIGGVVVPVPRDGTAEREPDGRGKWRYRFVSAPMDPSDVDALVALAGDPSGADSERAWDGTLLTDRPLVDVTGLVAGATPLPAEVTITGTTYRHHQTTDGPRVRYLVSVTLREG